MTADEINFWISCGSAVLLTCSLLGGMFYSWCGAGRRLPAIPPYPPTGFPNAFIALLALCFTCLMLLGNTAPSQAVQTDAPYEEESCTETVMYGEGTDENMQHDAAAPAEPTDSTQAASGDGADDTTIAESESQATAVDAEDAAATYFDELAPEPQDTLVHDATDYAVDEDEEYAPSAEESPALAALMESVLYICIYLPMLVIMAFLPNRRPHYNGLGSHLGHVVLYLLLTYGLTSLYYGSPLPDWLIEQVQAPEIQDVCVEIQNAEGGLTIFLMGISTIIVAPICEEVCYRGFLYNSLAKYLNVPIAILLSGLVFGAIHASLVQTVPLALFGMVLAYAYHRSSSLWTPILLHALFNGISFLTLIGT